MTTDATSHGNPPDAPHIAVLAFPFSSHPASLLTVVRRLASAAPPSSTSTGTGTGGALFSFFGTHKSNSSLFGTTGGFIDIGGNIIRACNVTDGVPEGHVFQGNVLEEIGLFLKAAREAFLGGMEAAATESGRRITCVFADAFLWFAEDIAADVQVPWVALRTGGPPSLAAHLYTDLIRDKLDATKGITGREDETLDFIPGMSKVRLKDLPEGILFGNLDSPFSRMLHFMGRALPRAAAVSLNSFEGLLPELDLHLKSDHAIPNLLTIGPLFSSKVNPLLLQAGAEAVPCDDEHGYLPWLDRQSAPVAYIGFGTVIVPPPSELLAIAEVLETTGVPFIWSLKKGFWNDDCLPKGFLDRTRREGKGMVVPWAPQMAILSHGAVRVFVTHCGWNSVLEGIAAGVPMICRPFFGDQRLNGRTIQDALEIGVMVEGGVIERDGLVTSLRTVMGDGEKGERMRENVTHLREKATKALQGSSTENLNKLLQIITTIPPPSHVADGKDN